MMHRPIAIAALGRLLEIEKVLPTAGLPAVNLRQSGEIVAQ